MAEARFGPSPSECGKYHYPALCPPRLWLLMTTAWGVLKPRGRQSPPGAGKSELMGTMPSSRVFQCQV